MTCNRCGLDGYLTLVDMNFYCSFCKNDYDKLMEAHRRLDIDFCDRRRTRPHTMEECEETACWMCMYLDGKRCVDGFYDGYLVVT